MKTLLVMGLLAISTTAFSSVARSYDSEHGCTLYRSVQDTDEAPGKLNPGEVIFVNKHVYGMSLSNLEINFDAREAKADINVNVIFGINQKLLADKSSITEENPHFTNIINQLNRKVDLMEKVCLSSDNKIVYTTNFVK
jgi:hypothetical protein